jgi:hypothetical protein
VPRTGLHSVDQSVVSGRIRETKPRTIAGAIAMLEYFRAETECFN